MPISTRFALEFCVVNIDEQLQQTIYHDISNMMLAINFLYSLLFDRHAWLPIFLSTLCIFTVKLILY